MPQSQHIVGSFDELIAKIANKKTLLICGDQSAKSPVLAKTIERLASGIKGVTIHSVKTDLPYITDVPSADGYAQIICIGGGKVIDIAKIASLNLSAEALSEQLNAGDFIIPAKIDIVCAPTTCGSGSEATSFAVCYLDGKKFSISHPSLRPDTVVLDPKLLISQTDKQAKIGALDAVCQAIESMFSVAANEASVGLSQRALKLGLKAFRLSESTELRLDNYRDFQNAANFAGQAINITKTNLPHALSYYLTLHHKVPHGLAVALFFEGYLQFLQDNYDDLPVFQKANFDFVCGSLCGQSEYQNGTWQDLLAGAGMPRHISDLPIELDLTALTASVNLERLRNFILPGNLEYLVSV